MKKKAVKHDEGKPALALIPHEAIWEIGKAFSFGAQKYGDHNWRAGFQWIRLSSAALRHITLWAGGKNIDDESGLSHMAHAGACVCMLIAHEKSGLGTDDRYKE